MIFKKIYTFLNDYFNGKKISKVFSTLIFTLIFSSILFCSSEVSASFIEDLFYNEVSEDKARDNEMQKQNERVKATSAQVQTNKSTPAVASFINSGSGNAVNEKYILYTKAGLPDNRIYTSYLPPANTYNKSTTTEHTLGPCGDLGGSGLKMIGIDCMIKIPFDCSSPPAGILKDVGVNCLNYIDAPGITGVFTQGAIEGKKLGPKKCEAGKTHARDCLTTDKNYCHETNKPILGINCKLAPCNSIPNDKYRRPGVNCLADCNKTPGDDISEARFFMEGFNCLSSCRTFVPPTTVPPTTKMIGENCVLEFNGYVMPLCSDYLGTTDSKHFNENVKKIRRKDCVNLEDLPLNVGYNGQIDLINSVRECSSASDQRHNRNCVNFDSAEQKYGGSIAKECHRYTSLASLNADAGRNIICPKINCHELSDSELARSFNAFDLASGLSSAKYCNPTVYREFSLAQVKGIDNTSKPYLKDYLLDYEPCYNRGDTEEIETIVSSNFYGGDRDNTKINFLKKHATEIISGRKDPDGLYDKLKICPLSDASEEILCTEYRSRNKRPPYDCNARSYCPDCPQEGLEICGKETDKNCYKNNINCSNVINDIYNVCGTESPEPRPDKDEYVSWFFRPTLPAEALQKRGNNNFYSLVYASGYPMENQSGSSGDDNIYMSKDNVVSNGLGTITEPLTVLWASGTITPPSIGDSVGAPGVGAGYICGMNGDYRGIPSDEATYFKGEVKTTYEADNKASHEVDVCIRYASSMALFHETCGYRKCKTSCAFGACTKACGFDVCRTLKIKEGSNQNCSSIKSEDTDCIKNYQTNLDAISRHTRVRIYKPDSSNYICAVLEFHGITTDMARRPFMNGTEFFEVPDQNDKTKTKKICVKGGSYIESSKSCKGDSDSDSNSNDGISEQWRTSKIIKYMTPPTKNGNEISYTDSSMAMGVDNLKSDYTDARTGKPFNHTIGRVKFNIKRYFEKSDCIRHQERVAGPVFFAIATPANSERLFLPAIEIVDKCRIAETGATERNCDPVDETDFFKPAITIKYGRISGSNSILSADSNNLNTNYKIIKINDPSLNRSEDYKIKPANIGIVGIEIPPQTVFIKKESSGFQPRLCLYKKIPGTQDKSQVIECVNRRRATGAIIEQPSALSHTTLQFQVGFLKDEGNLHSSFSNTVLTKQPFVFQNMLNKINSKELLKVCSEVPGQGSPICIERDVCTLLNNECVENEKSLVRERNENNPNYELIKQKEPVSNYCTKELLVKCNLRKGYELTPDNQTLNTSREKGKGFNAPTDTDSTGESMYHGWFNEFCIVNGIAKLDDPNAKIYVERNVTENEQLGSCKKDPTCLASPLNATCIANGGCLRTSCCKIVESTTLLSSPATPHELGLCLPIENYLKSCPAISYATESNLIDPFFIADSYLSMSPAHSSHINRQASIKDYQPPPPQGPLSYNSFHAEYKVAYQGTPNLKGKCEGFYKLKNEGIYPSANCDSQGNWEASSFTDACKMHSCLEKKLSDTIGNKLIGANQFGQYPLSYDSINSPDGSLRGVSEGYANWEGKDKTTLLKESVEATSCIVGYALKNSTKSTNSATNPSMINTYINTFTDAADRVAINNVINSLYGKYNGTFSGGVKPTRNCNQLGEWEAVTNSCVRITCPAINFAIPAEAGAFNMNDYDLKLGTSTAGRKVIFSQTSPYSLTDPTQRKVKFKIETSISSTNINASVYLAVDNGRANSVNSFLIKDLSGSNPASIDINKFYVLEFIDSDPANKYWKIIQNPNDEALIELWGKSGGASFGQGYALRSNLFNYPSTAGTPDNHKVTGVCNEAMLYKNLGSPPQLTCDSNGNWVNLINPCVSDCKAISEDVGNNFIHGYAMWNKSDTKVSSSKVETSTGCVTGFSPYPYSPLFDKEGAKKDFGIGAVSNGNDSFMTSDSYHATATAIDGATFVATAEVGENLNPEAMNSFGYAYNLKIQTSNSQSQSVASGGPQGSEQEVFYLFNNTPLTMTPLSNKVWSKIKFSSFGTPKYSPRIEETSSCHLPYSKLIMANKCIGQTTCSISLSDFTGYDTNPCTTTNPGNGENGQQNNAVNSYGSGGGGGGGNNRGIGGTPTSSININGASGSSFYDASFHLTAPTLSDAGNKGLKVDLKVDDTGNPLFKGKDGSVKIMESTTQGFSSIARTENYPKAGNTTGVYDHEVTTGSTNQDIYIKYEMSGAGGGGGGQGLTQGTDGASGSKMMGGVFKVKSGDILKIYVGGGGGAGKTKCATPPAAGSFLDPNIIQPAIEIIEPAKKTNFAIKILNKIGSLFISEGWAQTAKTCRTSSIEGIEFMCAPGCWSANGNIPIGITDKACKARVATATYTGKVTFNCTCPTKQAFQNYGTTWPASAGQGTTFTATSAETTATFIPPAHGVKVLYVKLRIRKTNKATFKLTRMADNFVLKSSKILVDNYSPAGEEISFTIGGNEQVWESNELKISYTPDEINKDAGDYNILRKDTSTEPIIYKIEYLVPDANCIPTYTTTGFCTIVTCTASGNGYYASGLPISTATSGTTINCGGEDYPAYNGSVSYICSPSGVATVTGSCGCVAGYDKKGTSTACTPIVCYKPAGNGYGVQNKLQYATTGSGLITCDETREWVITGYTGSAKYTCSTSGEAQITQACDCATGYVKNASGQCVQISCSYPVGNGYAASTGSRLGATGTITCGGTGYLTTRNAAYSCTAPTPASTTGSTQGVFAITTPCECDTGYYKPAGSDACVLSSCQVSSAYNIGSNTVNAASTATSVACREGYYGTPTYTCIGGTYTQTGTCARIQCTVPANSNTTLSGTSVDFTGTTSANLTCNPGFASSLAPTLPSYTCKNGTGTTGTYLQTGTCNPISCSPSGIGYAAQPKSGKGSFNCDAGYVGTIFYTCLSGNPSFRIDSGSCIGIKCNLPEGANSNIVPLANSNPPYREVSYSPANNPATYTCASGYKNAYNPTLKAYVDPTYTCETNNAVAEYQNACEIVKCYSYGQRIYEYKDGNPSNEDCSTSSGYWGVSTFTCKIDGDLVWNTPCKKIKCPIPAGKNTTADGKMVDFSASFFELECSQGYYYEEATRPKYTCLYSNDATLPDRGILDFQGSCRRITCQIPNILNSVKDSTSVEWNGTDYITTTCKAGFYQVSTDLAPKYSCSGTYATGILKTMNPCAPVTCDLPLRFGMSAKTNLEYGINKATSCDKSGYSGSVTYTCGLPLLSQPGKGTVTGVSSTCTESSCVATGNNAVTFAAYVTPAGSSAVVAGGAGGKISNTIGFLNGGNGGNTATSRTSGSGGGGGSASMISINQRIIAIAGGGGGGAGGGEDANSSDAVAKVSNDANLDNELSSNVFGPYFIGEMQSSTINFNARSTTGILYGKVDSPNQFSLPTGPSSGQMPTGTFINEIFFASYGSPVLPQSLAWKYGSCHDPSSLTQSLNQCAGKTSCSIATSVFTGCQSLASADKKFGLVASYYYIEPTLRVVNSTSPPAPAYKIKEENPENQLNLKDGEVYTFVLGKENNISTWFKYNYLSDDYKILSPIPAGTTKIKVKFHRTNSTFSPTLKTSLSSWPLIILKSYEPGKTTSLSVGYIDDKKEYILTLDGNNWIIREYTPRTVAGALPEASRRLPERSCATNKVFSGGAVNVAWSLPNSSCVNYCPGYEVINGVGVGDDRINVGATQHSTSGATGVVYWRNGQIGRHSVMKFSNAINNGVFPEYTGGVSASDFRSNSARQYFALSRFCNEKGVWDDPVPLCAFSSVGNNDDSGVPVANGKSYIYYAQDQTPLSDAGSKYLRINTADRAATSCKLDYYEQTDDAFFKPNISKSYQPPKYKCVSSALNFVDRTFFEEDVSSERMPCAQYCLYSRIPQTTVSYGDRGAYMARVKGDILRNGQQANEIIQLGCASGFKNKLIMKTFGVSPFTWQAMVRSDINPKIECTRTGGLANWGGIQDDCELGRRCTFDNKMETKNLGEAYNNYRFPIRPYIDVEHRNNGMAHNEVKNYEITPPDYYYLPDSGDNSYIYKRYPRKNGKCGYCVRIKSSNVFVVEYKRKYLRSYSCDDGAVSYVWDKEIYYGDPASGYNAFPDSRDTAYRDGDPDINLACDNDPWEHIGEGWAHHPRSSWLGWCNNADPGNWQELFVAWGE